MALGSTQPLAEISTGYISWVVKSPLTNADNFTTLVCRLSGKLGDSTPWNPQGLSRPVRGLLHLYFMHQPFSTFYLLLILCIYMVLKTKSVYFPLLH